MSDNTTVQTVTADDVVALHRKKKELQVYLDEIDMLIKEKAKELVDSGNDLMSSDGIKVSYSESSRREILPEPVQMRHPDVYRRITDEQMATYRPKLTLSLLSRHLSEDDIMGVVAVGEPVPIVRFISEERIA